MIKEIMKYNSDNCGKVSEIVCDARKLLKEILAPAPSIHEVPKENGNICARMKKLEQCLRFNNLELKELRLGWYSKDIICKNFDAACEDTSEADTVIPYMVATAKSSEIIFCLGRSSQSKINALLTNFDDSPIDTTSIALSGPISAKYMCELLPRKEQTAAEREYGSMRGGGGQLCHQVLRSLPAKGKCWRSYDRISDSRSDIDKFTL